MNPATSRSDEPHNPAPPGNLLALAILKETSPELGIKIAYDVARNLRIKGAEETEFTALAQTLVTDQFAGTTLLPYLLWGFTAGFYFMPLPWRRDIEQGGGPIEDLLRNVRV